MAFAMVAAAQDPLALTGELPVNQTTTGGQSSPAAGMAADGTHVVVWTSEGQDGDEGAIVFRKFPGDGTAPFNEGLLNQNATGHQFLPSLGMTAAGGWIAGWDSQASGQGLRGRRTNGSGTSLGSEFALSESNATGLQFVDVARSSNGSVVAVWNPGTGQARYRLFDAAGAPVTGDEIVAPTLGSSLYPMVASRSDGGFVVAFQAPDDDLLGVSFQRFEATGQPLGDPTHVGESEDEDQRDAAIAIGPGDGFVIAWRDSALGLRARRFRADGTPAGGEIAVTTAATLGDVALAVAPGGGFVVAYRPAEVRAREFDRLGRPVGPDFQVNTTTSGLQADPTVGAGLDRFVVAWHSANFDGDGLAVVRRLYRLSSVFVDDFESNNFSAWSAVAP